MGDDTTDTDTHSEKESEEEPVKRRPKKLTYPRREPSIHSLPREIMYISADKTTCIECPCYPKEDPYAKPKKLKPCQMTPLTLYELAAAVVNQLRFPEAFNWTEERVAQWMEEDVGLPQYKTCILDNRVNGRRLMCLEDPSCFPDINIRYTDHIFMITAHVRKLFETDFIRFSRSIGLPFRKPLTYCTLFKSRTGPTWGIRRNWDRSDILRWMKILDPAPIYRDHWDLVWYWPPEFPKSKFARIALPAYHEYIPHYIKRDMPPCREYLIPRKFRLQRGITLERQLIWMEHRLGSPVPSEIAIAETRKIIEKKEKLNILTKPTIPKASRLDPPIINLQGLSGKDLILARRLMPRKKFAV